MQLFLKVGLSSLKLLARKQSLTWSSHSGLFWVIHFAINYRPTIRDCRCI